MKVTQKKPTNIKKKTTPKTRGSRKRLSGSRKRLSGSRKRRKRLSGSVKCNRQSHKKLGGVPRVPPPPPTSSVSSPPPTSSVSSPPPTSSVISFYAYKRADTTWPNHVVDGSEFILSFANQELKRSSSCTQVLGIYHNNETGDLPANYKTLDLTTLFKLTRSSSARLALTGCWNWNSGGSGGLSTRCTGFEDDTVVLDFQSPTGCNSWFETLFKLYSHRIEAVTHAQFEKKSDGFHKQWQTRYFELKYKNDAIASSNLPKQVDRKAHFYCMKAYRD